MKVLVFLLSLLLWAVPVSAQMHVTTGPDRYEFSNGEFMPRYALSLPNSTTLQSGANVVLPFGVTNRDAIEVLDGATLTLPGGAHLEVGHLTIAKGGRFVVNVPCGQTASIKIRNLVINATEPNQPRFDPFQWGRGIQNFGTVEWTGCDIGPTFLPLREGVAAGATVLPVDVPLEWRVGDEVFIPDSAQQQGTPGYGNPFPSREESAVRIASIAADRTSLTLTKALDFAHLPIPCARVETGVAADACADGIVIMPHVANMSRNVKIYSEDVNAPGHVAAVGHDAHARISGVEFFDIGRTTIAPLNSTAIDLSSIGTQQAGRYPFHFHHAHGDGSFFAGNSLHGTLQKWGAAIHGTSDVLVKGNVCVGAQGACVVNEDGNEVRNRFEFNFAARSTSNGYYFPLPATMFASDGRPGGEGGCYWSRAPLNTWIGNQAWNCNIGYSLFYQPLKNDYPSKPGGPHDAVLQYREVPIEWRDNIDVAHYTHGMEFWRQKMFPIVGQIIANGGGHSSLIVGPVTDDIGVHLVDALVVNESGFYIQTINIPRPYVGFTIIEDSLITADGAYGLSGGGGNQDIQIRNTVFEAGLAIDWGVESFPIATVTLENVQFRGNGWPMIYGPEAPWSPANHTPVGDVSGCKHKAINWNGSGLNYCLSGEVTAPVPVPVDCVMSAYVLTSPTDPNAGWGQCTAGTQTRTETWTATVLTPPANGGAACLALVETRTGNRACTVDPFPGSVNSRVCVPGGPCYEGVIPRIP